MQRVFHQGWCRIVLFPFNEGMLYVLLVKSDALEIYAVLEERKWTIN